MQVRYIGDPANAFEGELAIRDQGITFVKGEFEDIPDDHPWAAKWKTNPTFEVKGSDRPKVAAPELPEDEEADQLKAALDKQRIAYRSNAKLNTLRKLWADNLPPDEDPDQTPPVPA